MAHYYNKLMAIAMLLLITMISLANAQPGNSCGNKGWSGKQPCKDYAKCVSKMMGDIKEKTPKSNSNPKLLYTSWPHGSPSGSVKGYAICAVGSSAAQCKSCLEDAKEWLANNCGDYNSGVYNQPGCGVSYGQAP
ncbi:hypothetical protein LINPERPRIM_LOCUS23472 [Linum perenne]